MRMFLPYRHPGSLHRAFYTLVLTAFGCQVHAAGGVVNDPVGTAPDRYHRVQIPVAIHEGGDGE
jgi:hypothetical protein